MSVNSELVASKIRIVKWAKLADNQEPPAVNLQQLCAMDTPAAPVPVKQEPQLCIAQVDIFIAASLFSNRNCS